MDAIRKERGYVKGKVTRIENFLLQADDPTREISLEEIEVRESQLEHANLSFNQVQARLLEPSETDELSERDQQENEEFEHRVFQATVSLKRLKKKIKSLVTTETMEVGTNATLPPDSNEANAPHTSTKPRDGNTIENTDAPSRSNDTLVRILESQTALLTLLSTNQNQGHREPQVKLSVIKLPIFDGKIEEWKRYYETFKALVHDHIELSNIRKYQYLTSSLTGNAAKLIESIDITNENYEVAWDLLKKRYDDPKSIKKKHIHCLFEMPKVERESASAIRELVDHTLKHFRVLKAMQVPTDAWNDLILYMIEVKLDNTTRREWERQAEADDSPSVEKLTDFLQKRC